MSPPSPTRPVLGCAYPIVAVDVHDGLFLVSYRRPDCKGERLRASSGTQTLMTIAPDTFPITKNVQAIAFASEAPVVALARDLRNEKGTAEIVVAGYTVPGVGLLVLESKHVGSWACVPRVLSWTPDDACIALAMPNGIALVDPETQEIKSSAVYVDVANNKRGLRHIACSATEAENEYAVSAVTSASDCFDGRH